MNRNEKECRRPRRFHHGGSSGGIYGLGFIGACVYFIGQAATFGLGVLFLESTRVACYTGI